MKKNKLLFYCFALLISTIANSQKLTFKIKNDSINKKIFLTTIDDKVLKSIYEKDDVFDTNYLNLDEGYYLLKKDENNLVLYLKPSDELTISFDNNNFYKSVTFSGDGAYINGYLLNKRTEFLNKKGAFKKYYKKSFYEGGENEYLDRLDKLYKDNYGILFSSQLGDKFKEEEMKNLQYGYSLDLLKYQDANKSYKLKDSLSPSRDFLEPLNHIHFQNNQLFQKYNSYKELAILKWKRDIDNAAEYPLKQEILSSIRINALKEGILESLYDDMNKTYLEKTKTYYQLIKRNTDDGKLLAKSKEKHAIIRQVEATKNLSRFQFKNSDEESKILADFKGKYIFLNIWTTWCKTCLKQFENIEQLEDKFKYENIVFVSISVDKEEDYPLWKNTLIEHGLKGNQLFLNDSKSKFVKAYDIKTIPSFVIISPKGVPIELVFDKLSSKKTEKNIKALFKK